MNKTRITVDSVLDKDHVRVLISTDGKTEKPMIMEKKALEELLKERKDLWEKDKEGKDKLVRHIESEVVSFTDTDTAFFDELTKKVRRRDIKKIRRDDIKRGLKKPERLTGTRRGVILRRQKKLRERMEGT